MSLKVTELFSSNTQRIKEDIMSLDYFSDSEKEVEHAGNGEDGIFIEELLNYSVQDESDCLRDFDECLYCVNEECPDSSSLLEMTARDVPSLLERACPRAYARLKSNVSNSELDLGSKLIKLARKIHSVDLLIEWQPMIYIPVRGGLKDVLIKMEKAREKREGDFVERKEEEEEEEELHEEEKVGFVCGKSKVKMIKRLGDELLGLVLRDEKLYKNSRLCQSREGQVRPRKRSNAFGGKKTAKTAKTVKTAKTAKGPRKRAPSTLDPAELRVAKRKNSFTRSAHPTVVCEGCQRKMRLNDYLQTCLVYTASHAPQREFYFHGRECVVLRKLKESIRWFCLQSVLRQKNQVSTKDRVRTMLLYYKLLVPVAGKVPRPKRQERGPKNNMFGMHVNAGGFDDEKEDELSADRNLAREISRLAHLRSHAVKLVERKKALARRQPDGISDEYEWKFKRIPELVRSAEVAVYGESLWHYLLFQLQSKQLEDLWLILAFMSGEMKTERALELLQERRDELLKTKEIENLDLLCSSVIESANFTIATALRLAAFMNAAGESDLSRQEDFEQLSQKYINVANQVVSSVESDHLLGLMLETPTDLNLQSAWAICLENELTEFTDNSRIQLVVTHMWSEFNYLDPNRHFRTKDAGLAETVQFLFSSPAEFYYCPVGRYWVQSLMYLLYVLWVTLATLNFDYRLDSPLGAIEAMVWYSTAGFALGEFIEIYFSGWEYLSDVSNVFDVLILLLWGFLAVLRFSCGELFASSSCGGRRGADLRDQPAVLCFMFVMCALLIILWSRLALVFRRSPRVGPFVAMLPGMVSDILNWTFVLVIFYVGFSVGIWFIIAGDITEDCTGNADLNSLFLVAEYMFYLLMGQSDWSLLDPYDGCGVSKQRSYILKVYTWAFSLLGTTMLLNLLIAMMASTYERKKEGTVKEVNFARAEITYELVNRNAIIPPPLNLIAFVAALLALFADFAVVVLTSSNCMINLGWFVPVTVAYGDREGSDHKGDHESNRESNHESDESGTARSTSNCCFRMFTRTSASRIFEELFGRYYCRFCRSYMPPDRPGHISNYFKEFKTYRLDEADVSFTKSLLESVGVCPRCYRPFTYFSDGSTNRYSRPQVLLELSSFYVFCVFCYVPLLLLLSVPAAFNFAYKALRGLQSAGHSKSMAGDRKLVPDSYQQMVEQIIREEGEEDFEQVQNSVRVLNGKLKRVSKDQKDSAQKLGEISHAISDVYVLLNVTLLPELAQLRQDIAEQRGESSQLRKRELSIFMGKFQETTDAIQRSQQTLQQQADLSVQHSERLETQLQMAQSQSSQIREFNTRLSQLASLRSADLSHRQEEEERAREKDVRLKEQIAQLEAELRQQRQLQQSALEAAVQSNQEHSARVASQQAAAMEAMQKELRQQQILRKVEVERAERQRAEKELLAIQQREDMTVVMAQLRHLQVQREADHKKQEAGRQMAAAQAEQIQRVKDHIRGLQLRGEQKEAGRFHDQLQALQAARDAQVAQTSLHQREAQARKEHLEREEQQARQKIEELKLQARETKEQQRQIAAEREQTAHRFAQEISRIQKSYHDLNLSPRSIFYNAALTQLSERQEDDGREEQQQSQQHQQQQQPDPEESKEQLHWAFDYNLSIDDDEEEQQQATTGPITRGISRGISGGISREISREASGGTTGDNEEDRDEAADTHRRP